MWSVKCGVESRECEVWSVEWGGEFEDFGSVKCDVGSVECEVESVMRGVESGECEVWSVSVECKCGVWSGDCDAWSGECGVWGVITQ